MRFFSGFLIVCCFFVAVSGCNKTVNRRAIEGTVSFDGKPIDKGQIQFVPVKGGPSAGTDIKNGQYKLEGPRGPGIGQYRIEITSYRAGQPGQLDVVTGQRETSMTQFIPTKYNENSELVREITDAGESMRLDFELTSK